MDSMHPQGTDPGGAMSIHTFSRLALVGTVLGALLLPAGPAAAASTVTLTTDIRVGDSGTPGGTATFSRTLQADGTEVLVAQGHLLRSSVESNVCLSHSRFNHRQDWHGCPNKIEQTAEVSYTLNLGTDYVGSVLHIQFRVRMPEFPNRPDLANGYANWHSTGHKGNVGDQYGEVALAAPTAAPSPSPSPTAAPSPSPTAAPSPSAGPSPGSTASPTAAASGVSAAEAFPFTPTGVNAGNGGDAAPRPPVLPMLFLLGGLGLAVASARRLVRGS